MQKRKREIIRIMKEEIIQNCKSYIIIFTIFIIGILLGVMIINKTNEKESLEKYFEEYITECKNIKTGSFLIELKEEIKNNLILTLLLWFSGTTIIGIPIVFGIILYRGVCLGYTISTIIYIYGKMKGMIFIISALILHNLIFIPAIIILGVSSMKLYKSIIKDKQKGNIKIEIIKHSIISIAILNALIIEAIVKIEISYRIMLEISKYF